MTTDLRCESCRFLAGVGQFYDCRRHAPITFRERGGVLEAKWPQVESHHSCGDHEPKPPPDKTGWPAPPLAQDDSRSLFRWFASKLDARRMVRAAALASHQGKGESS